MRSSDEGVGSCAGDLQIHLDGNGTDPLLRDRRPGDEQELPWLSSAAMSHLELRVEAFFILKSGYCNLCLFLELDIRLLKLPASLLRIFHGCVCLLQVGLELSGLLVCLRNLYL